MTRPCVFGEVLFDHFPDGRRVLGGAPFNVAWHLSAFGLDNLFISRVGDDEEGDEVRDAMQRWGMDSSQLQTDDALPTGRVSVTIEDGEPHYDIVNPSAWDRIEVPAAPPRCELLYHGSLALRDAVSRSAAEALLGADPELVFVEINLRPPWYQLDDIRAMLRRADWLKLNEDEFELLAGPGEHSEGRARELMDEYGLSGLILTVGAEGASLLTSAGEHHSVRPRQDIDVVDTVGAGDAFTSVIVLGLCREWPLDITLRRAQDFASAQVGQRGATVDDHDYYRNIIGNWT